MEALHSLKIEPVLLLANAVLFLVLLGFMNAVFWKPIMRHLNQRAQNIEGGHVKIDETRKELERLRVEYQGRLTRIEADARARIQGAVREAQTEREHLITEARAQAQDIIASGTVSINSEKVQTLSAMRAGLDQVALDTLSKALGSTASNSQRQLIDEYIAQNVVRS